MIQINMTYNDNGLKNKLEAVVRTKGMLEKKISGNIAQQLYWNIWRHTPGGGRAYSRSTSSNPRIRARNDRRTGKLIAGLRNRIVGKNYVVGFDQRIVRNKQFRYANMVELGRFGKDPFTGRYMVAMGTRDTEGGVRRISEEEIRNHLKNVAQIQVK